MSHTTFKKHAEGILGFHGQLYETKLLSLIYFRAKQDPSIEEFYLATNVDEIGTFDDICLRAKVKGANKPLFVFIQAKHSKEIKRNLKKYFNSYLRIRDRFEPSKDDNLFKGEFDKTECLFVMYTLAKQNIGEGSVESSFASNLKNLINTNTGGSAKQSYSGTDLELLLQKVMDHKTNDKHDIDTINVKGLLQEAIHYQINMLAQRIAEAALKQEQSEHFQNITDDELIIRYHVILAQNVFDVSEIEPEGHRVATFRQDFFDTKEPNFILLKNLLYAKTLKNRKTSPDQNHTFLKNYFKNPSDITILSKLIGTVLIYNKGKLEYADDSTDDLEYELNDVQAYVSPSIVKRAIEQAARELLSSLKFKVPAVFGNKDLTIEGNAAEVEAILNNLTSKMSEFLDKSNASYEVTIDDDLKDMPIRNEGLASTVGNILVFDNDNKLMKFTDDVESLGDLAKRLYHKLKTKVTNLEMYKFRFKCTIFPRLSFDYSQHEVNLVKDFLNRLIYYTNQADESGVGVNLKREIEQYQNNQKNYFQLKTDAIFLNYHDAIQKWWMQPEQIYLTKESKIFENATINIIRDPLISVANAMYMHKMQNKKYKFKDVAVTSLNLQDQYSCTVIIAKNSAFTVAKVMQHLENKKYVVLDLEHILNLPLIDRHAIQTELKHTEEERVLIFVFDKIQNYRHAYTTMKEIATAVNKRKTIIVITNNTSIEILDKYFLKPDIIVRDERNSLIDMSKGTQNDILKDAKVIFQGYEKKLNFILDDESMLYVEGDVLNSIINKDKIEVGKPIVNEKYYEIKHLYVDRNVTQHGLIKPVKSLQDIDDDVVLITATPGMGKSTLLTQLSHETKKHSADHKIWIVRINLIEYSKEFNQWQKDKTVLDKIGTLNFLCQVIIREKLGKENHVEVDLEETNGVVNIKQCTGDQWTVFELKLFLHFYNREKLILLFDGFDEICPHYMKEVLNCLKTVRGFPRRHKMWVTSRSYNEVNITLITEFGDPYELEQIDKEQFLNKFWKSNLILNELDSTQLDNVIDFIEFTTNTKSYEVKVFEMPLHDIYMSACQYLINEIKNTQVSLWRHDKNYDETYFTRENPMFDMLYKKCDTNPLNLFITADFFVNNIKDISTTTNKWNRELNTFKFYEKYLETKLKKIRFQEKNKIDIDISDNKMLYEKECADMITKHKQIAAYAFFYEHRRKLFNTYKLKRIKKMMKLIEHAKETTGLIYTISNDIPIFIHMTFTEYFAVEYLCDILKNEHNNERLKSCLDCIFNVMFSMFSKYNNTRYIFDYKMKTDVVLMRILENSTEEIFNLLMEQGKLCLENYLGMRRETTNGVSHDFWACAIAAMEGLHNFTFLFKSIFEKHINESNINNFIEIIALTKLLAHAEDDMIISILDIVRKLDKSQLSSVLYSNFYWYMSRSRNYEEMSSKEIVECIREDAQSVCMTCNDHSDGW